MKVDILKHWPIITVLGSGLIVWGHTLSRVAHAEEQIQKTEEVIEEVRKDVELVKQSIVKIETSQSHQAHEAELTRRTLEQILLALRAAEAEVERSRN